MSERIQRRRHEWQALIEEQAGSGQTIARFCEQRSLSVHCFYYHKRRLQEGGAGPGFREVRLKGRAGSAGIRLVWEQGRWEVEVERNFDAQCLRQLLQVFG